MGFYPDDDSFGTAREAADALACSRCGQRHLSAETVSTAFWRDSGLVVIRDIPAMVCPHCHEEFIADGTAAELDRMRRRGFTSSAATERIEVPVFRFPGSDQG